MFRSESGASEVGLRSLVKRRRRRNLIWLMAALLAGMGVLGLSSWKYSLLFPPPVESMSAANGTQLKFRTHGDQFEIYRDDTWHSVFLQGVNMGATIPGHFPGELAISKATYLKWFQMIRNMGSNVIRIYTILPPRFYSALVEFNRHHSEHPLYIIQGVWSPVQRMNKTQDALDSAVTASFLNEISDAVGAVYGKITIPAKAGNASGTYTANAGPYLAGWMVGTEWDPGIVVHTNTLHDGMPRYQGKYFEAKQGASPFEDWLAEMLDHTASVEQSYGWEHPIAFTNWVTTDPLHHPGEPLVDEDKVSVDATHIKPADWQAGYYASFHIYPYYPDFFHFDKTLDDVKNDAGQIDPYKSYLRKLKAYHKNMPIVAAEFGVPSSLGIAHRENLGRSQGGHTEAQQGRIDASLFKDIVEEHYAGAIVFSWQDEWFKKTWNVMNYELQSRKPYWLNVLSAEDQFGLLGMYPGKEGVLNIDGNPDDWKKIKDKQEITRMLNFGKAGIRDIWVTHDEGYVYLRIDLDHPFDPQQESLNIGVDTLPGGNRHASQLNGVTLDQGLETLIHLGSDQDSRVEIASNYDFLTRLYGIKDRMIPVNPAEMKDNSGMFRPWDVAVGLRMEPPDARIHHPFEQVDVGRMIRGNTNLNSPNYNSLALWDWKGSTIEMRIPWMLLGFSDPSTHHVISYRNPMGRVQQLPSKVIPGIRFVPWITTKSTANQAGSSETGLPSAGTAQSAGPDQGSSRPYPVSKMPLYQWKNWNKVTYHAKVKQSYVMMKQAFLANEKQNQTGK